LLNSLKADGQKLKIIHRGDRAGFKGGALNEALKHTSPKAEYVVVLDADFVPDPDLLRRFLAYFNKHGPNGNGGGGRYLNGTLAAVQGYQWHTLNRSENWLTRGVSCEFSGNYMVDRTFQEVAGTLKMVAGSVYMIRADLLRKYCWSSSLTEDWELTLRLYEDGYKVLYTPLIQAPAECPSTLGKLIRQRMRWAEGHTYNVKRHFLSVLRSSELTAREKLEFLYYAPFYLQSVFLILGTFFWLMSDIVLGAKIPFWTAEIGWGLVITNLLALPLMSLAGLFLEKRAGKDLRGIISQIILIYALSPYQAYSSLKGLVEPVEGSWVRTFKSGKLAGFPGKLEPRKVIKNVLPPRKKVSIVTSKTAMAVFIGLSVLLALVFVQGQSASSLQANPAYYFYDQPAPAGYSPYPGHSPSSSFLMHLAPPAGADTQVTIEPKESLGLIFFSDPSPSTVTLPAGATVSIQVWVNAGTQGCKCTDQPVPDWSTTTTTSSTTGYSTGVLYARIDIYNPGDNDLTKIAGAQTNQSFQLLKGINMYQASWGNIAQGQSVSKGETLMVTVWCAGCTGSASLFFNSSLHPSNIDFPVEVPENSLSLLTLALLVPGVAGLLVNGGTRDAEGKSAEKGNGGLRRVQGTLLVAAALIFLTLPLVITFGDVLASIATVTGFDRVISTVVPFETSSVGDMLRGFGLPAGNSAGSVWIGAGFIPVSALVDWNCAGWQGFILFGLTSAVGLGEVRTGLGKCGVVLAGVLGVFAVNVVRIMVVVLLGYYVNYQSAIIFHDYGGAVMTLGWLVIFWSLVLRRQNRL
jgi:exosortase/archaeosortase family protein